MCIRDSLNDNYRATFAQVFDNDVPYEGAEGSLPDIKLLPLLIAFENGNYVVSGADNYIVKAEAIGSGPELTFNEDGSVNIADTNTSNLVCEYNNDLADVVAYRIDGSTTPSGEFDFCEYTITLASDESISSTGYIAFEFINIAPNAEDLKKLSNKDVHLKITNLSAGYGKMEILHNLDLYVGKAQSLCLIGPNGAGKSTILHSIYGFTNIFSGKIEIDGKEITNLSPAEKLKSVGIAYILQDNSVFPDMTVEENLLMGGFIKDKTEESYQEAERILEKYERLRNRRNQPAKVLSGGERRLLEISRALVMKPSVLLVDEPSICLLYTSPSPRDMRRSRMPSSA